ncbi:Ribonuclease H-like superfamily [Arabidopsis suecica]|uniref:Ribonuclease H-like superfamily n=1 Tax=Arabidopsis suecica TaxID=45249 RepID=A0A8T1Y0J9_ARASU|nr:Ribonuclease H-like superfamily [Arabidopsis suecica]
MATSASTSSSTSSALTEVVAQPRVEMRRTISPYDLTSGDNPGTLISKPLLHGTIPQPTEDDADFEDWTANNALVISWIRLTIDESLTSSLSHINDSNELWIHVQKRFGVKNGQRVQRLKTKIANCRQKGLAIEAYYGKLTQLWGSLADYQWAKAMEEVRKVREEDKPHQYFMGLDDTLYGAVKSNLLSRVPLPSLEEAYNALTLDEKAKQLSRDNEGRVDGVSFAVQITSSRKPFDNRAVCTICGCTGHISDNCFRKIGYPDWWGENSKSNSNFRNKQGNNSGKGNSNYGGAGRGMTTTSIGSLTGKNSNPSHANSVFTSNSSGSQHFGLTTSMSQTSPLSAADRVGISGLSNDQWQTLVNILEERKARNTNHQSGMFFIESWIIDTRSSNHMTRTLEFLMDIRDMAPVLIKLTDGRFTTANKQGRVSLGSSLCLQDVFFVDGLKCHLVSVSQLTRERGGVFQLTDKLCIVQDRITKILIGVGIIHETSCVGTPQQNGRVERKHRHILNVARALLFQANLPAEFWSYCALTVGYLINRTPTQILDGKTPFELNYNRPPPMNHMRVFGCLCYVHNQKHRGDKFAPRSSKSIFIGYPFGKKGWRVYNLETGTVSVSRDVVFQESEFQFAIVAPSPPPLSSSLSPPASMEDTDLLSQYDFVNDTVPPSSMLLQETPVTVTTQSADTPETSTQTETVSVFSNPTPAAKDSETVTTHTEKEIETENNISTDPHQLLSKTSNDNDPLSSSTSQMDETEPEKEKLGFGYRKKTPLVRLADYVTSLVYTPAPSETPYPLDNFISSSQFSDKYQAYLFAITSVHEPQHYNEAILDENWRFAVKDEIEALEEQGTWTVEDLPPNKKPIGCK